MHYSNYQPFPIPPLPAPPAPDVIGDVLHASPAPKSPPPTSGWPLPQSPPLYPPLRPRSGTATSDRSTRLGSTIDTPKHASSFAPLPSDINKDQSDARAEDDSSGQAEARSNRKIADLEITNRSLMSINMMLEATKVRQAKEIRDLRRRLRETRLVLPPRAFAALRSSDASSVAPDVDVAGAGAENDGEDDEDSDVAEGEVDQIYDRVSGMIERMLGHAKEAVERAEKREEVREGMVKVLSAAEVAGEVYHDAVEDDNKDDPETDFEDEGTSFNTGRESVDGGAEKMGTEASDQETEESDNGSEAEVEDLIEGGRESFVSAQSHLSLITDLGPHPGTEGSPTTLPSSTPGRSLPSLPLLTITAGTPIQSTRPTFPPPIST
ncbi:hypothetical protein FRB97_003376 [Tulasnella sp. 331]|nr:hypothetical protein FRB97_003376 [Tulasnella sp. 331]